MKLPSPSQLELAHSARLQQAIADEIIAQGPLSFARYMQKALYEPGLGYYSAGATKFGQEGDYVTAPILSNLFSKCLAKQCQQVIAELHQADILELGAGTGVMALDMLLELEQQNSLPQTYFILEVSADLRQRQQLLFQQEAPHLLEKICWLDALPQSPISGIVVANEVIDAMPVHRFLIDDEVQEYYVDYQQDQLIWKLKPATNKLTQKLKTLEVPQIKGYSSEVNLLLEPWLNSLSESLAQGIILFIDYGYVRDEYYHPQRSMGTLLCHFKQHAHDDPLLYPGIQDITAFVDFTAVAEAAVSAGLDVSGFTHQAGFLVNAGLMEYVDANQDAVVQYQQAQQIKRLTLPSEMGERFKAIALSKSFDQELVGFSHLDQIGKL